MDKTFFYFLLVGCRNPWLLEPLVVRTPGCKTPGCKKPLVVKPLGRVVQSWVKITQG